MTWKEYINHLRNFYVGKSVVYGNKTYKVVDVDYNGMLLIDRKGLRTETTAVNPLKARLYEKDC